MKRTQRRERLQIIFETLVNAREPIKKTKLMSVTRVSFATFEGYLSLLLETGLIERVPYVSARGKRLSELTPSLFVTTSKGEAIIQHIEQIINILGWSN